MTSPSCSIVIRAYNEEKHLERLLTGIQQQTLRDVEVLLVDSGSTDGTIATAARYQIKVLHIRPEEFTFGRSLNLGISEASSEAVVIASAHVYPVYPDWLEKLLLPLKDPAVALSYGKQRGGKSTKFSEQQVFYHWYPDHPQPRQAHPFCNNANAAVRRSLWSEHPYDETLPGLEDVAWASWALQRGMSLAYVPEAEVIHLHDETPKAVYNRYRREAIAFKRIFPDQHFHFADFIRLFLSNALSDVRHASRQRFLAKSMSSILWFRWMQFWGTFQGYRHSGPLTWQLRQTFYYPRGAQSEPSKDERPVEPIQYPEAQAIVSSQKE